MGCINTVFHKRVYGWINPKNIEEIPQQDKQVSLSSSDHLSLSSSGLLVSSSSSDSPDPLFVPAPPDYLLITGYTIPIERVAEEIITKANQKDTMMEWAMIGVDEGIPHDQAFDYISIKLEQSLGVIFTNNHFQLIAASIGKDNTWVIRKTEYDGKNFLISIRAYHNAAFDFSCGICNTVS